MEKIAIIDMGSNSIRYVALQIADNKAYFFLNQEKEAIRLGHGLSQTGRLSDEGMERAMTCLHVYKHMMKVSHIHTCLAVATAAVRNAENGMEFLKRIHDETGIQMDVITGEREAYLGYLGVANTIDQKNCLIFDLGGASVEITLVHNGEAQHSVSIPIGAVTLTEKFSLQGDYDERKFASCLKYINKKLTAINWIKNINVPLIGIGGTARTFAKMDQKATNYEFPKLHNYIVPYKNFSSLYKEILSRTAVTRKKITGLSNDRADLIVAGAAVIQTLFTVAGSNKMIVSGCGLREGLFFEYYAKKHYMDTLRVEDILDFSVRNFIGTIDGSYNETHSAQVARVADMLFDQLKKLHGFDNRQRLLLHTAARLHDIGKIINFYNHARHSAFMIAHAPLYGLTQKEQIICGFIAGFHHGINRKTMRAYRYATMCTVEEWNMIRKLSTLLSLAEASDSTYEQLVTDIKAKITKNGVVLTLTTPPGAPHNAVEYEMKQLEKQFKKEFGLPLLLTWK